MFAVIQKANVIRAFLHFRSHPPQIAPQIEPGLNRAISSAVERFLYTEDVGGSIPSSPTSSLCYSPPARAGVQAPGPRPPHPERGPHDRHHHHGAAVARRSATAMSRIGRNTLCPCGSGKKYKHCCGKLYLGKPEVMGPTPQSIQQIRLQLAREEAREHQRRLLQGLGQPIISFEDRGYRIVAIGTQLRWSKGWRTFPDFLFDYIKLVLTPEWGNAELAKPEAQRHPLLDWYRKVCDFQRAHQTSALNGIHQAAMTGAVRAYLGLAYDLYLCAHNVELPDLLLKRLRNAKTFEGALYEAYVIANLAKAGFHIELEDESDSTRTHCELTATHKGTGRRFSVEAKAIASTSTRAGSSAAPPRIRGKLYDALCKQANHERLVFIEINREELGTPGQVPDWVRHIDAELSQAEKELTVQSQPAPPAYVFVTNRGFVHALDSEHWSEVGLACGYKIDDFASRTGARSMLDLAQARERQRVRVMCAIPGGCVAFA
jgi:hypothetical protein